ncbi:MAG TPA: PfkB family carbohydrate kinase [Terriglobia bacterium]|nr:PfkB family carbohydrate kinase [Terriglobia bacterium]
MSLLVVGSIAFDSIRTPYGEVENILGGAATFFSVTASWFTPVSVVAVVGADFGEQHLRVFRERGIDTAGVEQVPGRTFRWKGEYTGDMNSARTLDTQLNVFEKFVPKIPAAYLDTQFLFLGNIDPVLQLNVRRAFSKLQASALDTMNFWIQGMPEELGKVLATVDILLINEGEARMISRQSNLKRAAEIIRKLGPRVLVIKRGEHGATLFGPQSTFTVPAFPLDEVHDPTGAGDTFAGGFMGHLARTGDLSDANLRRCAVYGSVMGSFAVEEFGLGRLLRLTPGEIESRYREIKQLTHFDA